jgi:hypothetical protein
MAGFVPNSIKTRPPRYSIQKGNCLAYRNVAHWTETQTNPVLAAGLSLTDPRSQIFVNACLRHPDFKVLAQKGDNGQIIRSPPPITASRTREASSRAGLQLVPWDSVRTMSTFQDSILEEARPLIPFGEAITECFQVVIVDIGEGEMQDFILKLLDVWYKVYEVGSIPELYGAVLDPTSGETRSSWSNLADRSCTNKEIRSSRTLRRMS